MKKALIGLAAFAALAVVAFLPLPSSGAVGICDPQQSALCSGLVEVWSFDEPTTDGNRFGSYANGILREPSGIDVGYTTGKISNAAVFTGGNRFEVARYGSFVGYTTVAAWVYQTTQTSDQQVLGGWSGGTGGVSSGSLFYLSAGKPTVAVIENDTGTQTNYSYATAISPNAWHLVVWRLSPFGPYGKAQACISVDNGAFTCSTAFAYTLRGNSSDMWVGFGLQGRLDGLLVSTRTWSPADVALYWNSGNGRGFPFY